MSGRFDALLPRALDRELDAAGEAEFLDLLRDPANEAAFEELTRIDREIAGLMAAPVSDDTLERLVWRDIGRGGGGSGHTTRILAVLDRVRRDAPPTRRKATRRASRRTTSSNAFGGVAAALFAAALLLALLSTSSTTAVKPHRESARGPVESPIDVPLPPPKAPAPSPRPESTPEPLVVPAPSPRRPDPAPPPVDPAPTPEPAPKPLSPTVVSVATVERAEGRTGLKAGQELLAGHDLDTGADGLVVLRLPDAIRVDLGPGTRLTGLSGASEEKRFTLLRGTMTADVSTRPATAKPFVVHTPEAQVSVLGTRFSIALGPGLTRLDVERGRVKLSRRGDGASAEVAAGQAAVTGAGIVPVARRCPLGGPLVASFTLIDVDTGKPVAGFDPVPDDATLALASLPPRINLRANTLPATVGSVVFGFDGNASFNLQNGPPYAAYAFGDKGRYQAWTLLPGSHALTATPYAAARGGGDAGGALTLSFKVVNRR